MLLKVLVYAYICNEYSSRRIEQLLRRDVHFMWLSAMTTPDHNTINRFRSQRLNGKLKDIFTQVVKLLGDSGHISLRDINVDGTKIEANANRYTFVWCNAIKTNREKIAEQLEELWNRSGYQQTLTRYQAKNCNGCPLRGVCHKQQGDRIIEVNQRLRALKKKASERLKSEEGIKKRKKRCWDVERIFANWKQNKGFRCFVLRGKDKVTIEIGLISLAHNLQKLTNKNFKTKNMKKAA